MDCNYTNGFFVERGIYLYKLHNFEEHQASKRNLGKVPELELDSHKYFSIWWEEATDFLSSKAFMIHSSW